MSAPAGVAVAPVVSRSRRWAVAGVLSVSLLVLMMDLSILDIAIPDMTSDLQPSTTQLLWIVDVYSLVLAGLLVSVSSIADRWGRKRMTMAGYAVFGAASALVTVADSANGVIAVRALLGIGGAMIMPTTLSMLRTVFADPRERAMALGLWSAVSGLGAAVGPLVGGVLLEHFSWHSAFLVNVPIMVVTLVAGWLILPESRRADPGRWDAVAAVQSIVGVVALIWAIKRFAEDQSLLSTAAWVALAIAVVLLALFVHRCVTSTDPLLDLGLFRRRQVTAGVVGAFGVVFALAAAMLLLTQWMQLVRELSPLRAGLYVVPSALMAALASVAAPGLARRLGVRPVLAGALVLAGSGLLLPVFSSGGELSLPLVVASMAVIGTGMGGLALGSAMIMSNSPEERAGNASAIEETSYELGNVMGVAVLGSISGIFYRVELSGHHALDELTPSIARAAEESLGGAVTVAHQLARPELAAVAARAFTESLQFTSLAGGALLVLVGALVFALIPRGTDITRQAQ